MKKAVRLLALLLVLSALPLAGCDLREERSERKVVYYEYFDTVCSVTAASMTEAEFARLTTLVEEQLKVWHTVSDGYHVYESGVSVREVNERAAESPVPVSSSLTELLLWAKEMCRETLGAMNPVLGSVTSLWHNARETALKNPEDAYVPTASEIAQALLHTRIEDLALDTEKGTVFLSDGEMRIDLGACAKGYAEERIASLLEEKGYTGVMLNFGGNIRVIGMKKEKSWVVGIQDPSGEEGRIATRLSLTDIAVSTSGSYFRYYDYEGVRYHHLLDPETGYPASGLVSVTVVARDAGEADVLSTALFSMSVEEGLRLIGEREGTEALWILESGEIVRSEGFSRYEVKE